tara:strand:+ start:2877 stop:3383 length:507 start_codon:yes stop_codon:yes gene_type:complete
MQIIGIDPGLRKTGWGIVSVEGNIITHVSNGTLKSSESNDLSQRLLEIFVQLIKVIEDFKPQVAAVENTFINKDAAGALKLGQARAIALLAPAKLKLPVFEYAPNTIKKAVVGVGHADKLQVKTMVQIQLPKAKFDGQDSVDALSIALCHAYQYKNQDRLKQAISKVG